MPGGYKQRLAMAAALLHEPEILFLDEPTSGADPLARREFWQRITGLAEQGVTVIVTTHFMEEAEYCDRVVILDAGRVLAQGTPAEVRRHAKPEPGKTPTMEDAFIAIVEEGRAGEGEKRETSRQGEREPERQVAVETRARTVSASPCLADTRSTGSCRSCGASGRWCARNIAQIIRDPSSIAIGVVMPVMLILLFGYGLSLDVKNVPVAIVLEDPSPDAHGAGGPVSAVAAISTPACSPRCRRPRTACWPREVDGIVRIRSDFARNVWLERRARCRSWCTAPTPIGPASSRGMPRGRSASGRRCGRPRATRSSAGPVGVRDRMWFNEANDSHYFLVPGLVVLVMTLIGAMLTALVMAREWERGTLEALFVTPVRADEILLGKTIPYFVLGMIGLALCLLAGKFLFHVPFRGSVVVLAGVSMLYLLVALGIGLLDFVGHQEPVRRQPVDDAGHVPAGHDAVGLPVRSAQHAGRRCG